MKPTYLFNAYPYPAKGDVLTTRQIEQKINEQCTAEVWPIGSKEPIEVTFYAWVKEGDLITSYDLDGSLMYQFKIREVFTDRYVVDEAAWV